MHFFNELFDETQVNDLYLSSIDGITHEATPEEVQLEHEPIEIGEPVIWNQEINLIHEIDSVSIELPEDAEIINIQTTDEQTQTVTDIELSSIDEVPTPSIDSILVSIDDKMLQEEMPLKLITIEEQTTEINVEFETPAPYTVEQETLTETNYEKEVTVAHESTLHYTDVKTYSDLPEEYVEMGVEFNLYWEVDGQQVDVTFDPDFAVEYLNNDGNEIYDQMCWIVPQLSEQTFQIVAQLTVINTQSFPTVGDTWEVRFTTLGTADLTISAVDGTTWSLDEEDSDLNFVDIRCGEQIIPSQWIDDSIFIPDYSCDEISFETSDVLTPGEHNLEFIFGTDTDQAHNDAQEPPQHTLEVRVSQSSDDAEEENDGDMDLDSNDLYFTEKKVGVRFQNIEITQGSLITNAYIQFEAQDDHEHDSTGVDIFAEAIDDSYLGDEDTQLIVDVASGVLDNDSDVEGNSLTAILVICPPNATSFTLNPDGSFTYTPNGGFNGQDSFTYVANDGTANSNEVTVTINVIGTPAIVSAVASGGGISDLSPGDETIFTFSDDTRRIAGTFGASELNELLVFSQNGQLVSFGTEITPVFQTPSILVITTIDETIPSGFVAPQPGTPIDIVAETIPLTNAAGTSKPFSSATLNLEGDCGQKQSHVIISTVADDLDGILPGAPSFSVGDIITISISGDTNQSTSLEKPFVFTNNAGIPHDFDYTGEWINPSTYVITITDIGTTNPIIGDLRVSVASGANITNSDCSSCVIDDSDFDVEGNFDGFIQEIVVEAGGAATASTATGLSLSVGIEGTEGGVIEISSAETFFDTDGDGIADDEATFGTSKDNDDTDGDDLLDGDEVNIHSTNPFVADTDGDSLNDGLEAGIGTNPLVADTDGDGLTDDIEIILGTDPLDSDTDADGSSDGAEDLNANGIVDDGETDPLDPNSSPSKASLIAGTETLNVLYAGEISAAESNEDICAIDGCVMTIFVTASQAIAAGLPNPFDIVWFHDSNEDQLIDVSPDSPEVLNRIPAPDTPTTTVTLVPGTTDLYEVSATVFFNSKFAVGGVKALALGSLAGGSNLIILLSVLHH